MWTMRHTWQRLTIAVFSPLSPHLSVSSEGRMMPLTLEKQCKVIAIAKRAFLSETVELKK